MSDGVAKRGTQPAAEGLVAMTWRWRTGLRSLLGFGLLAIALPCWSEKVSNMVDLDKPGASEEWVSLKKEACIRDGELVLDGLKQGGVAAFLKEPVVSDMTLTCKVYVEPAGKGVRAFQVHFHSSDSVSYQYVHVNRGSAMLCWSKLDKGWNELARVGVKRPEGKWLDVKLECAESSVRFYLGGKLVISKDDVPRKGGGVGFSTSQGLVRVKDIHIEGTAVALEKPWQVLARPKPPVGTFQELPPQYRHTDVSGKFNITVGEPYIISSCVARPEMGAHEQPHLFKLRNGDVLLLFHKDRDIHGAERVGLRSRDNGKTWTPDPKRVNRDEAIGALKDGRTVLVYDCYSFLKGDDVYAKEMFVSRDGGATFEGPLLAMVEAPQLGQTLSSPVNATRKKLAVRYKETSAQWSAVGGPNFWRTILELDDGSLLSCGHTKFKGDSVSCRIVCYKSVDKGMNWRVLASIAQDDKIGFFEPVMTQCSNGDVLCVIRTGGGSPLMQARSTDGGETWGEFKKTGSLGVDPDLCLMSNGILACSYGRPGNRIMFSIDGTGKEWTDRLNIYEYETKPVYSEGWSFGYTGIVEVEPGRLLFVYDRRDAYPEYDGRQTTAIQGVYITVRRK